MKQHDSILDWQEISLKIPESNEHHSPLQAIKNCLETPVENDPFEMVEEQLKLFTDNLKKSFNELNK